MHPVVKHTATAAVSAMLTLAATMPLVSTKAVVHFSPNGGCAAALVEKINSTQKTLDIQAYSFTHPLIAQAIIKAKQRGVMVRMILDKSQPDATKGQMAAVQAAGIPIWIDHVVAIAHSKVMIFDGKSVHTGSFNFTEAADKANAENSLLLDNKELAEAYMKNFEARLAISELVR